MRYYYLTGGLLLLSNRGVCGVRGVCVYCLCHISRARKQGYNMSRSQRCPFCCRGGERPEWQPLTDLDGSYKRCLS